MKNKFFIYLFLPLLISAIVAGILNIFISRYFIGQAKDDVENILLSNRGFHQYIQKVLHPAIFHAMEEGYIKNDFYAPQAMSSTYIVRTMHGFYNEERTRQGMKPVYYKLAANNPRNPVNKADEWEARKIKLFNDDPSVREQQEIVTVEGKKYLYYAIPFLRNEPRCMRCHGDPKNAPVGLRRLYPGPGGFYEKVGEIRAIESMRMPIAQEGYLATIVAGSAGSGLFAILVLFIFNSGLRTRVAQKTRDLEIEVEERRKAEDQARKSGENFRMLFTKSADAIFLVRPDGSIADVNETVCRRYHYSREELVGMNVGQIDSPATRSRAPERTAKVVRDGIVVFEAEHISKDGRIFPVEANASAIVLDGEPLLISTCRDITDRKKAEEVIAAEKERLAVTLRSIGDGVIVTDIEGRITLINRVAEQLTGWHSDEASGKMLAEVFNIINETTRVKCENPVEKVLSSGMTVGLANHTALIRKDGTEIVIADSAAPIRDRESRTIGVVLVFRDVTAQYRMEQEMQKMQKLESLGLLAGGLAHDFNNLLTSILGNVSLVKMQVGVSHKSFPRLTDAEQAARRAADLTQQLLTFAKGGAPIKKPASVAEIAKEAASFALSGSSCTCLFTIPQALWSAEVDKGQISQVFNNLIINSVHAMPKGGAISIVFENAVLQEHNAQGLNAGDYLRITVSDEGTGIPEEIRDKIFEPYFTTKTGGSGLGLATVLSIIHRHEGRVSAESKHGNGATFLIYLPAIRDTQSPVSEGMNGVQAGQGRILVMDDETLILNVAVGILNELGYEVAVARDGKEAIEAYQKAEREQQPFDVVIMDLTIPGGMGGKEAVRNLHAAAPNARVVVSSGYSMDPIMADYETFGFCGVVRKPYNANELSEVIARVRKR